MPKEPSKCFVIGYPAFISETDFKAKYPSENTNFSNCSNIKYDDAVKLMYEFGRVEDLKEWIEEREKKMKEMEQEMEKLVTKSK